MGAGESKPCFRHAVKKMKAYGVPFDDEETWDNLMKLPTKSDDVHSWLSPEDVAEIKNHQPLNLAIFVRKLSDSLTDTFEADSDQRFYTSVYDVPRLCSMLKLLSRVLPQSVELDKVSEDNRQQMLGVRGVKDASSLIKFISSPFHQATTNNVSKQAAANSSSLDSLSCPHSDLAASLLSLLFCHPFTVNITKRAPSPGSSPARRPRIWAPGPFIDPSMGTCQTTSLEEAGNRVEVLRCILAGCVSEAVIITPQEYPTASRPFAAALIQHLFSQPTFTANQVTESQLPSDSLSDTQSSLARDLLYSLLNTIISYKEGSWFHSMQKDAHSCLLDMSVGTLLALIDSPSTKPQQIPSNDPTAAATTHSNPFKQLLASIQKKEHLQLIFESLVRLLRNPVIVFQSAYIQDRIKVECYPELLVLVWRFLDLNQHFLVYSTSSACDGGMPLLEVILQHLYLARKDPGRVGLVQNVSYILLLLSSRREFAVALNSPITSATYPALELPPAFQGSHADAIVHVIFRCIVTPGGERLVPLYTTLLTSFLNTTPYCKALTSSSCERLVKLLETLSSARVLLAAPNNFHWTRLLLHALNNLLQFHLDSNHHLIYSLLRRSVLVSRLCHLDLEIGAGVEEGRQGTSFSSGKLQHSHEAGNGAESVSSEEALLNHLAAEEKSAAEARAKEAVEENKWTRGATEWVPTEEWLEDVKSELPTKVLQLLIQRIVPIVDEFVQGAAILEESAVVNFLKRTTLVGLLPPPPPITVHRYAVSVATETWMSAYTWGLLYLRCQVPPFRLFDGLSNVTMIKVAS